MKGKTVKRLAAFAVSLAMIGSSLPAELGGIGLFDGFLLTASAADTVSYTAYKWENNALTQTTETVSDYTVVTKDIIKNSPDGKGLLSGTYVVTENTTVEDYVYIRKGQTVNLIVPKGVTLTCKQGIGCGYDKNKEYATLNIYGEGKIVANGKKYAAGIGGKDDETNGSITIHGTEIEATGGHHGAGIGGGEGGQDPDASSPTITIYAGKITANGGTDGAGIGGGDSQPGARTYIYGGDITATSEKHGAGIGGGDEEGTYGIWIYGGKINATGGHHGAGIGAGEQGGNMRKAPDGGVNIFGGEITATGGVGGAGIGGGYNEDMSGEVNILGDATKLMVIGGESAAGIGAGNGRGSTVPDGDMSGTVTINCGIQSDIQIFGGSNTEWDSQTAHNPKYGGAGIGAGYSGNMYGKVYLNGGNITITSGGGGAGIGGGAEKDYYGGEGGTVYIGGGNINIKRLRKALSHEAIGYGDNDGKSGTVYIASSNNKTGNYMRVVYNQVDDWGNPKGEKTALTSNRSDKCHTRSDLQICECPHTDHNGASGITYTIVDNSKHIRKCKYCGLNETEAHKGSDCECGYSNPNKTVKLSSFDGITTATVASGKKFTLPYDEGDIVTGNTVPVSYYEVTGWKDRDGKSYEAGSDVTITEDMEFTLQHEKRYIVECSKNTNGKIKADADFAKQGETVSFSAEPEPDYSISKVLYTYITGYDPKKAEDIYAEPVEIAADAEGKYQLTMPDFSEPANGIIVSAEFVKSPYLSVYISDISDGTVESDKGTAIEGETVTLEVAANKGFVLDNICVITAKNKDTVELTKVSETTYTFTMPSESVVVSAEFEEDEDAQSYISGASLSLEGEIGVNIYIKPGNNIENGYVKVKGPNDIEDKKVELTDSIFDNEQQAYKVSSPVYAPQMGEKVEFTLFDENNVQHELWNTEKTNSYETYRYAVNDYIETVQNSENAPEKLKAIADKMQNFGAWARDSLIANNQISSDTAEIAEPVEVTGVDANTFAAKQVVKSDDFAVDGLSVSLFLDSETALRIYYTGDEINGITAKHGAETVALTSGTSRDMNYVEIKNISAYNLGDDYEITFGDKGALKVSPYSYCCIAMNNSNDVKLKNTVKALYEYCEAAKIFFSKT